MAAKRFGSMRMGGGSMGAASMGGAGPMGSVVQQAGASRGMGNIMGSKNNDSSSQNGGGYPSGRSGSFSAKPAPKTATVS